MPGMTGFDLVKAVKEIDATISIFLMSAYEIIDNSELNDIKIDGVLKKPIGMTQLLDTIEKAFNEYHTLIKMYTPSSTADLL